MATRRKRMNRVLPDARASASDLPPTRADAPRRVRSRLIDFSTLHLPPDVTLALAEAFWNHIGAGSPATILTAWSRLKPFSRFVTESGSLGSLADVNLAFLARYVEWLNTQRRPNGQPWTKSSRAGSYTVVRTLLLWLDRCRPGVLGVVEYPLNPFPWRNRDSRRVRALPALELRAILKACEHDISQLRALRARVEAERSAVRAGEVDPDPASTLGGLLEHIDRCFGGIVPSTKDFCRAGQRRARLGLAKFGGVTGIERCLYPDAESLFPYYLAIQIHAAGNAEPIVELACDCLQPIPLLDDREMLVWMKRRAGAVQRRSFRTTDPFEPPSLVREILEWTQRLRPHVSAAHRSRLFLHKTPYSVTALSADTVKSHVRRFLTRHDLPRFSLASIRPSVLSAFYRASGDLLQVKAVANHACLSTTVRYVESPAVEEQHRARIGALQIAYLGRIEPRQSNTVTAEKSQPTSPGTARADECVMPDGPAVTMFGFTCKDPYAGIAPGTRRGELCANFLGCLTCPNAIIAPDAATLARLLQARDHLRAAVASLHPARWEAIYAPQLKILEEDILTRFGACELVQAEREQGALPPLPDLR